MAHPQTAAPSDEEWLPTDATEEVLEKWLCNLRELPADDVVAHRVAGLERRLAHVRGAKTAAAASSTVQLLRAQSTTKKRQRQKQAAAKRVHEIDQRMALLHEELDEAPLGVERAEANLAEATEREREIRANVAKDSDEAVTGAANAMAGEELQAYMG